MPTIMGGTDGVISFVLYLASYSEMMTKVCLRNDCTRLSLRCRQDSAIVPTSEEAGTFGTEWQHGAQRFGKDMPVFRVL